MSIKINNNNNEVNAIFDVFIRSLKLQSEPNSEVANQLPSCHKLQLFALAYFTLYCVNHIMHI